VITLSQYAAIGRGDRGRGRGRGRARDDDKEWVPVTKLGRLVKEGKIKSLEEIYSFSMRIQECQIVDLFLGDALKDEVCMKGFNLQSPYHAIARVVDLHFHYMKFMRINTKMELSVQSDLPSNQYIFIMVLSTAIM
jgi:hypothetical protein